MPLLESNILVIFGGVYTNIKGGRISNMKTCQICGNAVEDTVKECPNCGSFNFVKPELKETVIKMRKLK